MPRAKKKLTMLCLLVKEKSKAPANDKKPERTTDNYLFYCVTRTMIKPAAYLHIEENIFTEKHFPTALSIHRVSQRSNQLSPITLLAVIVFKR